LQDSDLDDEAWNDEGSDSGSSNALSYVSDMLDDAARNKKRDLILVFLFHLFISNKTFSSLLFKRIYA
jgi:translation initiation factor 2-alpha kinase 4